MYFYSYMALMLYTCTIQEFFKIYNNIVPYYYIPDNKIFKVIFSVVKLHTSKEIEEYSTKFLLDLQMYRLLETDIAFVAIEMMSHIILQAEPSSKIFWAKAAGEIWSFIQVEYLLTCCVGTTL